VTRAAIDRSEAVPGRAGMPDGNSGLTFFRQWLKAPRGMGSVAPSSRLLARAMAAQIPPEVLTGRAPVIELGGGTGSITRGLLTAGVRPENLFVVERNQDLAELLRGRFTGVEILCGDATSLPDLLRPHGIDAVGAIVSSLPLLLFSEAALTLLVQSCFTLLGPGQPLIQFTYGLKSPLAAQSRSLIARRAAWVPLNLPPAFVWTYRRGPA